MSGGGSNLHHDDPERDGRTGSRNKGTSITLWYTYKSHTAKKERRDKRREPAGLDRKKQLYMLPFQQGDNL
jgi:hypothetical protein